MHDHLTLGRGCDVSQSRFRFEAPLRAVCAEVNNLPITAIGKQHRASGSLGPLVLLSVLAAGQQRVLAPSASIFAPSFTGSSWSA